jgi:hypothetical protein
MKKLVHLAAYSLLAFALYLNFIHKDDFSFERPFPRVNAVATASSNAVPVSDPEKYLSMTADAAENPVADKNVPKSAGQEKDALKLSVIK